LKLNSLVLRYFSFNEVEPMEFGFKCKRQAATSLQ